MCDTVVATNEVTADGVTLFGKNSDREPNEAHHLVLVPAADHPADGSLRCTYIEIPQASHTYAVLLAKPFWIWGAEMGANEHGVVIGNEAVFTKMPYAKEGSLIGMDLLRLGLERGKTAREALDVITGLMMEFGQGGNCGYMHALYYHNSYIIADPHGAWVLETAGPHWAARQIKGVYTISNGLTIGNGFDLASPELVSHAVEKGWCKGRDDFDFARCYSDLIYTHFSDCRGRCRRTTDLLSSQSGQIKVETLMNTLRDHEGGDSGAWRPDRGVTGADVCMHASFGPIRASQSVGSMVSHLIPEQVTHFFTATSAPCTSVFKPVWMDAGLPEMGQEPEGTYDQNALFWRHERLHRATLWDYPSLIQLYQAERDSLEREQTAQALELAPRPAAERLEFSAQCFAEVEQSEAGWLEKVQAEASDRKPGFLFRKAWDGFNSQAKMPEL